MALPDIFLFSSRVQKPPKESIISGLIRKEGYKMQEQDTEYDVIERISKMRPQMSKGQKRIADFIVTNYDSAAYMTACALGEAVMVSESTVVRFAMALGYEGYPELQKSLQELIRNKLTSLQRIN